MEIVVFESLSEEERLKFQELIDGFVTWFEKHTERAGWSRALTDAAKHEIKVTLGRNGVMTLCEVNFRGGTSVHQGFKRRANEAIHRVPTRTQLERKVSELFGGDGSVKVDLIIEGKGGDDGEFRLSRLALELRKNGVYEK